MRTGQGRRHIELVLAVCAAAGGLLAMVFQDADTPEAVSEHLSRRRLKSMVSLPESKRGRLDWYVEQLLAAHQTVSGFASRHGWIDHMSVFWHGGFEVYESQERLWRRICEIDRIPTETAFPTTGLAAGLEGGVLVALTPEEYARVQPRYGTTDGAYARLLAHEIAHRLHVAILEGDEDAMGPQWFYEGFAVVASGDLLGVEAAADEDVWEHVRASGEGAYAHYAAALRFFTGFVPLEELVGKAGEDRFEEWLERRRVERSCATGEDRGAGRTRRVRQGESPGRPGTARGRAPDVLSRQITEVHGRRGVEWLRHLETILERCAQRWEIRIEPPMWPLSYNYVAPAIRVDGTEAVLKVGVPCAELAAEIEALAIFDGRCCVRLLEADPELGALLLERLKPGTPLAGLPDAEATSAAVQVMQQLWRPVPSEHGFPLISDWATGFDRLRARFDGTGPFPPRLVQTAEELFSQLRATMADPVLLHGDLHHWNILAAERKPWLAIDPKGVIGEPAYEVGALLRNPMPELLSEPEPKRLLHRRVSQLVDELGMDRDRIVGWGTAQAVLAGWWSYEDHGHGWEPWIDCARMLASLI